MKFFSLKWKSSKKARKQRKYRLNAPLHVKHKMVSSHLSKELIKQYNRRSIPVRKNDVVKIVRGSNKGKSGKIEKVLLNKMKVYIEGITQSNKTGKTSFIPLDPSNLIVTSLYEDKKRILKSEFVKDSRVVNEGRFMKNNSRVVRDAIPTRSLKNGK
ncbi:50S ribosomal protein L24 [Candidatus Woesearchaeota archaeon]|nr:50S ribosomal protein L24P [uncultured archaeon]MBS3140874.1 50S ribosomal protein L24 [Candidatus Woesearchaeota archaeon]